MTTVSLAKAHLTDHVNGQSNWNLEGQRQTYKPLDVDDPTCLFVPTLQMHSTPMITIKHSVV